jgi:hypothetical protein
MISIHCLSPGVLTKPAFSAKLPTPQGRREQGDALSSPSLGSSSTSLSTGSTPQHVIANEVKHRHARHEYSRWQSPADQWEIASPQKDAARNDVSYSLSGAVCHG